MQDPQVVPGALVERPSPHGPGVVRVAHGEFVGPHGELASYAFGWSPEGDEDHGRITVGIGAGNEGGGSFHAAIVLQDGDFALGLVDEPFAVVAEGGPDLSRAEALAHEDLAFVWFVTDLALARDPRAWWLRHWLSETQAVVTAEVDAGAETVVLVQHDEDGIWQCIGASDPDPATGVVVHLWHLVDQDPTLVPALDLAPGRSVWRPDVTTPWRPA